MARFNFGDIVRCTKRYKNSSKYVYGMVLTPIDDRDDETDLVVITGEHDSHRYPNGINKYIAKYKNHLGEDQERVMYYNGAGSVKRWTQHNGWLFTMHEATIDEMVDFMEFIHECDQYDALKDMLEKPIPDANYTYAVGGVYETNDMFFIVYEPSAQLLRSGKSISIEKVNGFAVQQGLYFVSKEDIDNANLIGIMTIQQFHQISRLIQATEDGMIYLLPKNATRKDIEPWLYPWSIEMAKQYQEKAKKK